jgi:hypothetical protein
MKFLGLPEENKVDCLGKIDDLWCSDKKALYSVNELCNHRTSLIRKTTESDLIQNCTNGCPKQTKNQRKVGFNSPPWRFFKFGFTVTAFIIAFWALAISRRSHNGNGRESHPEFTQLVKPAWPSHTWWDTDKKHPTYLYTTPGSNVRLSKSTSMSAKNNRGGTRKAKFNKCFTSNGK